MLLNAIMVPIFQPKLHGKWLCHCVVAIPFRYITYKTKSPPHYIHQKTIMVETKQHNVALKKRNEVGSSLNKRNESKID